MSHILSQVHLPPLPPLPESFQEQELPGFPSQPIPWTESCSGRLEVILEKFKESVKFVKIVMISKNKKVYKMRALGKVNCFTYWYALYKIPLLVPVKNGLQAFNTKQFIHFGRGVASLPVLCIPQIGAIHPQAKNCRTFSLKLPGW